jgi:hypothetical protein
MVPTQDDHHASTGTNHKYLYQAGLFMIGFRTPVEFSPGFDIPRKIVIVNAAGIRLDYPV